MRPKPDSLREDEPVVWVRPSQVKIKYPESLPPDPAALIIDVFPPTRMKSPARLTSEVLINLSENGVPHEIFLKLLREGLDDHIAGLIEWDGVEASLNLWCILSRKMKASMTRRGRQVPLEARLRGYDRSEIDAVEDDDDDDDDEAFIPQERDDVTQSDCF